MENSIVTMLGSEESILDSQFDRTDVNCKEYLDTRRHAIATSLSVKCLMSVLNIIRMEESDSS